jgi:phosphatidylserine/phosphatidylglycerophosphate/cardiolipin synthase-like enzyme
MRILRTTRALFRTMASSTDGETVLTGSFNFIKAVQERNAENLVIIHCSALAAQYPQNWDAPRQHSQPYVGPVVR